MSWMRALALGLVIVAYFIVTTVLVPDRVLQLVASASSVVRDLVVLSVWAIAFGAGLYMLRLAQSRKLI